MNDTIKGKFNISERKMIRRHFYTSSFTMLYLFLMRQTLTRDFKKYLNIARRVFKRFQPGKYSISLKKDLKIIRPYSRYTGICFPSTFDDVFNLRHAA